MPSIIDRARERASSYRENGSSGGSQQEADSFLARSASSLKKAGEKESAFGLNNSESAYGGPVTSASDPGAPAPSINAGNESNPGSDQDTQQDDTAASLPSIHDVDYNWQETSNKGDIREVGGKKGRHGVFGRADYDHFKELGYSDNQITKFIDKNVGYDQLKSGVKKDLNYQYKGDKVALEDYDHTSSGRNEGFDKGNLAELQAMGYSDAEIQDHMQSIAGKNNENIGDIGGDVQRKTGFGVRTDLNADNISEYGADEIGRTWQEKSDKDHYTKSEMRALAQHNEGLSKQDVANEMLRRQADALKEGYEGPELKFNKKAQAWMDRYGGEAPESDPQPEPEPDPTPDNPTPDPEPDPTPEPAPTPEPSPSPGQPEHPVTPPGSDTPSPPPYGYVPGNPYSKDNPGYYYGTQNQQITEKLNHQISANAANAMANGLADIETWQASTNDRLAQNDRIMQELYKKMGLIT